MARKGYGCYSGDSDKPEWLANQGRSKRVQREGKHGLFLVLPHRILYGLVVYSD